MNSKNRKRSISLIILFSMLISLASCGSEIGNDSNDSTTASSDGNITTASGEYDFPKYDCGGDDFSIMNASNTWSMYSALDFESQTGEILDDAIYNRNRELEERYAFSLKITEYDVDKIANELRTVCMANEDIYDVVYCPAHYSASLIGDGFFKNLFDIPQLKLEEEWWNQEVTDSGSLGKGADSRLYYAASDFQLFGFDGTWCVYFNESMLADLGLDTPY